LLGLRASRRSVPQRRCGTVRALRQRMKSLISLAMDNRLVAPLVITACAASACNSTVEGPTPDGVVETGRVLGVTLSLTTSEGNSGTIHYALHNDSNDLVHVLRRKTPLAAHPDQHRSAG
jgi:hypothetical protein